MKIEMYATPFCGYCARARHLLDSKEVDYEEIRVDTDRSRREQMLERSGKRTVPQIFIDGRHIGGSDELAALESSGELDELLSGAKPGCSVDEAS